MQSHALDGPPKNKRVQRICLLGPTCHFLQRAVDCERYHRRTASGGGPMKARMAEQIEPLLRKAGDNSASPEVRRRIPTILAAVRAVPSSNRLRTLRAITALERIGTPEAREVLKRLADGDAAARETREAKAALE